MRPRPSAHPQAMSDPTLEPGFPVSIFRSSGSYHAGPAIHALIAELDGDPQLEIVAVGMATGPIYAWNHDGTLVPGWPVTTGGAPYPAAGPLAPEGAPGVAIAIDKYGSVITVVNGAGQTLAGWPRPVSNYVSTPPSVSNTTGTPAAELFLGEEDQRLHGYSSDGAVLTGWPVYGTGGQERHTPAIADLDGDGSPEILTGSGATTPGVYLFAYHADGGLVSGFPFNVEPLGYGTVDLFPAVGDVDNDGAPEIVVCNKRNQVFVIGGTGAIEATLRYAGRFFYSTAPALGDFDGDGRMEIAVQTNDSLNVLRANGDEYPGWPITLGPSRLVGNSAPVIGDVDGDGDLDVAIVTQESGSSTRGDVRVYDRTGTPLPGFPKELPLGSGAVPAIADLDLDGRNELVVAGNYWSGQNEFVPAVWVFDLGGSQYGEIAWGQFMHDAGHTGHYVRPGPVAVPSARSETLIPIAVWPNPARVGSLITLAFSRAAPAFAATPAVEILDVTGRRVNTLACRDRVTWDGRDAQGAKLSTGVYVVRCGPDAIRMVLLH
jgi:hypothetical protein